MDGITKAAETGRRIMSYLDFALTKDDLAKLQQAGTIEHNKPYWINLGMMRCNTCSGKIEKKSNAQKMCEYCSMEKKRIQSREWKRINRMKLCTEK